MPELTVVTAAYLDSVDKMRWLREAYESIAAQDYEDWEWVVVDDASPTSPDLPSDVRVRYVRAHERSGAATCRNTAVALARSPCAMALDADDMLKPGALKAMRSAWAEEPDRFVFGDMEILENGNTLKVVRFPEYEFAKTLEPKGVVPVTGLFSIEAWHRAGGWKPQFNYGLEDVEFWISMGKAGVCGKRIDRVVLVYRRHPQSRTQRMRQALQQVPMERLIREMHADVYGGNYPMGCCGGKKRSTTNQLPIVNQPANLRSPTPLDAEFDLPGGKVWVEYLGGAEAEFQVRGEVTGAYYKIKGHGHKFQAWAQDSRNLAAQGRGKFFRVGVSPPRDAPPPTEPQPEPEEPEYQPPAPELATIEKLDPVAASEMEVVEPVQGPDTGLEELDRATEVVKQEMDRHPLYGMEELNGPQRNMLEQEGWDLAKVAAADPDELVPYPTIGTVTAAKAIAEANRMLSD
jgi:glycosyltransferase involved in cell wall biosynthesis